MFLLRSNEQNHLVWKNFLDKKDLKFMTNSIQKTVCQYIIVCVSKIQALFLITFSIVENKHPSINIFFKKIKCKI